MTECEKCNDHSGVIADMKAICRIIDEKEKQASIHLRNYEREVRVEKEQLALTREQMEHRLAGMNEFQKCMDKLEGTFATKADLTNVKDAFDKDYKGISRLVYIGIGIMLAIQFLSKYFFKGTP